MPYKKVDVQKTIEDALSNDPELKQIWEGSRSEYLLLGELVKLRKEKGLTQAELAKKTGNKQQLISRIENKENSPTLKTLCALLDALDTDIVFIPRHSNEKAGL